jgi:glucokinase
VAEWTLGAGTGVDDLVMVALGTGIGGGLVMGGRLQRGHHGFAGEIGHMTIVSGGRSCGCGRRGCWERYASGSALADHARVRHGSGVSGEDVIAAARRREPWAHEVVEVFANWVGMGLANLANIVDPQRFVIGGGLAEAGDVVLQPLRQAFSRHVYAAEHRPLADIEIGRLGEYAGAVGAGLLTDLSR